MDQLLNYLSTYPNATVRFCTISMIFYIHSNTAYMVLPEAHLCTGGYFYLSNKSTTKDATDVPTNRAIHNECSTICNVIGSTAEAEVGGLYVNCQQGEFCTALQEMGYPQHVTIVITDDSTADGIVNIRTKQPRTRSMDMRFYWIKDRIKQGHYLVMWQPRNNKLADYSTKYFPSAYYKSVQKMYLVEEKSGAVITCI
eukprot:4950314-Ditylum_brightwellii.AAC.1